MEVISLVVVIKNGTSQLSDKKVPGAGWFSKEQIGQLDVLKAIEEFINLADSIVPDWGSIVIRGKGLLK